MASSTSSLIQQASPFLWCYDLPDISMDRYTVVVSKDPVLGTSGLASCFAIGARGKTKDGTPCLGLAHTSHGLTSERVIEILKKKMCEKGCLAKSIELFVAGGGRFDEGSTEEMEEEIQSLAKKKGIVATALNLSSDEDETASALMTQNGMFWSKKRLFEMADDLETIDNTGDCLLEASQEIDDQKKSIPK